MQSDITIPPELKETIEKNNQSQLLKFFEKIESPEDKQKYLDNLSKTNFPLLSQLFKIYNESKDTKVDQDLNNFIPIKEQFSKDSFSKEEKEAFIQKGFDEITQGHVALLLLAGGLGTRLGCNYPKGMYNIEMPSKKSLFEYFSNRFQSIQNLSKRKSSFPHKESTMLIMTSQETNEIISKYFKENNFFGLKEENVIFFPQSKICGLTMDGKIVSLSPKELYTAPDGNGGCFTAMKDNKICELCEERGISFINVIAVDNPIYKVMDPFYVGMTINKGTFGLEQMSAKVLKRMPSEKVGLFLNYNGHPMMMDYMDLPEVVSEKKNEKGELVYNAGNLLDYIIGVKFINKILNEEEKFKKLISMFHFIHKKTNCVSLDDKGNLIQKKDEPFLKFEIFFNSIFEFASIGSLLLLEVQREEEFAPVKNKEGDTSKTPSITRKVMSNLFKTFYKQSGGKILNDDENKILEISFLDCYDGTMDNLFENKKDAPKEIDFKDKDYILI
ncbi:MAG: UTP--glucose-1-phosphate uridylyltransferase [archaeon]|nr:UTP--glucose-1-phosphate uridylyltransferase [archaeon]